MSDAERWSRRRLQSGEPVAYEAAAPPAPPWPDGFFYWASVICAVQRPSSRPSPPLLVPFPSPLRPFRFPFRACCPHSPAPGHCTFRPPLPVPPPALRVFSLALHSPLHWVICLLLRRQWALQLLHGLLSETKFKRLPGACSVLSVEIITLGLWVFLVTVIVNYDLPVNRNAYAELEFETYLFRIGRSTRFDPNDRFF